jgi:hypothetical protein
LHNFVLKDEKLVPDMRYISPTGNSNSMLMLLYEKNIQNIENSQKMPELIVVSMLFEDIIIL